ncbi:MAG: ComEC/Rec2 family competence protein, partial [Gammaproteobacteria bacterium]
PFWKAERPDAGELWMTVLDVGQGLSIVVQTQNHVLIYDAGPGFPSGYNTGDSVVLPFLAKSGIHRIDKLMISHSDTDHAGGAEAIFRAIHVDNVLAGEPEKIRWAKSRHCHKNASWRWDQVAFRILSPTTQQPGNNGSCVLQITDLSGSSVLVPGDIEWPIEHYLVNKFSDNLDSDVLVAPHHGSKTSSRFTFLQHISPETVLIPAGYKNRYGFPHPLVVDKYRQLETDIFVTGIDGALFVKSRKNAAGYSIDTYRKTHKRYWQTVLK